ncbi:hypothetical protein V496_04039 [Pseudogymnoascus sp. VKM F-4515 (FW-2607)]|nr:hypothetical protein V496_04039 [Pseudogymnoascus sp. VKM F-4515 (FW-2607)]KFY98444.1 hypothetical protein V498_01472 [Pseudogymnoascus sp. VKM F-4517 (FW-2822)]
MADSKKAIRFTITVHLLIQLTFLVVRIPSLALTLSTFATFYYFFGLPANTIDPQPTVDAIYLAAYILNNIAFFLATLSDLTALYFALPFRNPLRALSTRHLSTRIHLEKVTSWLLIYSTAALAFFEIQQDAALLAGLPSYETPKRCSWLVVAML